MINPQDSIAGPCYQCEERYTACHDHCAKYQFYKAQLFRARRAEQLEGAALGYIKEQAEASRRGKKRRYKKRQ